MDKTLRSSTVFDFIEAAEFRRSLESDHAEMERCAGIGAWKAVQVLAGSIVEALLIDYVIATESSRSGGKEPLRMDLAEVIILCRKEGLLTDRSADLSTVIRSYRNLIHPGRVVRLGEDPPSENSGVIAMRLVDMITKQVEAQRRTAFGLTAEQLLTKLERDDQSLAILNHLLTDVTPTQRARFLLDVLPPRYMELKRMEETNGDLGFEYYMTAQRLAKAYRQVLLACDDMIKRRAAEQFVRLLREEDGDTIRIYRDAFFRGGDLPMVAPAQRAMVLQHLLTSLTYHRTSETASLMAGLAPYLSRADVRTWVDPYVRPLFDSDIQEAERSAIRKAFIRGAESVTDEVAQAIDLRLKNWVTHFGERTENANAESVEALRTEIDESRSLPF